VLEREDRAWITPVEANAALTRAGLLIDYKDRPGLPLRRLLRAGKIPHAYQLAGKRSRWVIPSSKAREREGSQPTLVPAPLGGVDDPSTFSLNEELRLRYRPEDIRVLMVGESPPAGGTFFYRANSLLFRATREAFRVALHRIFLSDDEFLSLFKDLGFYLDDLSRLPLNQLGNHQRRRERTEARAELAVRIAASPPQVVITVMMAIASDVEAAVALAGLPDVRVQSLPFPHPAHRKRYVAGLVALIAPYVAQ
jgi:hypothetical protein